MRQHTKNLCFYCGEVATETDHIVPRSKKYKDFKRHKLTVTSCRGCNHVLFNSYQSTLAERKKELKERLVNKYQDVLNMPHWSQKELDELGPNLRSYIKSQLIFRQQIIDRLIY